MPTEIKCPQCAHVFQMEDAISEEYKNELRAQMRQFTQQKEAEFKAKLKHLETEKAETEKAFSEKLEQERNKVKTQMEEQLRKQISADFEAKMELLEGANKAHEEKLKLAREKELDFLRKEQILKEKEADMELQIQRKMQEQREQLAEQIRKQELERSALKETEHQLKMREMEKQLEDQKKLVDEMKRKAEQGSMQLQGEVQELILEEMLREYFPFDLITEVGKGVRGADCIQIVRNQFGQECGKIIYESKRTKTFSSEWIEKLKKDMRSMGVDVPIIVTQAYPSDMDTFGLKEGVWICSFEEVKPLAFVLREHILKLAAAISSQENKGEKMHMLYDYLTGSEFSEQWKAIREGFMSLKVSIQKERDAMERLWKQREKQLEKVLLNATHIQGSIEGIAGADNVHLSLTDDEDPLFLED